MSSGVPSPRAGATSALLTSPPFVASLFLLLLNDWLLKRAAGNWFTGKLSDFAGLFAFALFWTALLPRRRLMVLATVAMAFVFWKSPLSAPALDAWNALAIWPLTRVVDYSDWLALTVLLPAHVVARRHGATVEFRQRVAARRSGALLAGAVSVAAFAATSVPPPSYDVHDPVGYDIPAPRAHVKAALDSLGLHVVGDAPRRRGAPTADTVVVYIRHPPERHIGVRIEVREITTTETRIRLLRVSTVGPEPTTEGLHRAFEQQVVDPLRTRLSGAQDPDR